MAGGYRLTVTFVAKEFDEPGLVLDLFVEDARGEIIGTRIFAEGHVTDRAPAPDGATLGFKQQGEDVDDRGRVGEFGRGAPGLVVKFPEVVGQLPAQLVNTGDNELP